MIKKIPVGQLIVGMFIYDLNCSWMKHNFVRNRFLVDGAETLRKVRETGVKELFIDTEHGLDVGDKPADEAAPAAAAAPVPQAVAQAHAVDPAVEPSNLLPGIISKLSPREEFERAKSIYGNANRLMQDMMRDVRLGKQVDVKACDPMVDHIVESMFSFPSALLPLAQVKTRDEYTFQHSVSVAALAVAFGRVMDFSRAEIKEFAMGGMLHDVGKAQVPGRILNKPGKLDDDEFAVMKSHVEHSARLLAGVTGVSEIAYNAAAQHHERFDGSGYPHRLAGEDISAHGQMLAIVDVYDAITSIRIYHKGMPPTQALRKMYEWSGTHFNPRLIQAFIKGIGIYPAGTLVRMESERLGVVREVVADKLLQPIVQLIYDCKKRSYIKPEVVDLSASNDKIKSHENFEDWGIDQSQWLQPAL